MIDIDQIKQKINDAFSKYTFHEENHTYTYFDKNGEEQTIGISTTQLIHSYSQPFDEDKISKLVARREGITQQEVLDKWAFERDLSCEYGTLTHLCLECLWNKWPFLYDNKKYVERFGSDIVTSKLEDIRPAVDTFYEQFKDRLIIIGVELLIASEYYDTAGSIDLLAYSKKLDAIIIIDNKSNKQIQEESYNNKKMLYPLNYIPDSNYWWYSLQGAIYKRIFEYETGIIISKRKFLIWFDSNTKTYNIIECANLDDEAKKILDLRRKNDKD